MKELFKKVTNYYINRLPEDFVPFWDMSFSDGSDEPRDSSSAAIAVCGILEMLPHIEDEKLKNVYEGAIDKIMYSLYENYSTKETTVLMNVIYGDAITIWKPLSE